MAERIRVLIADDHPAVREGLRAMLDTQDDLVVVGDGTAGRDGVAHIVELRPDVVLVDLEKPGMNGVTAVRGIGASLPDARVIVLAAFDSDERVAGAMDAGASAYLLKGAPREEIFRTIRAAYARSSPRGPDCIDTGAVNARRVQARSGPGGLSAREIEVLTGLVEGLTNKAIAARLVVSERTIKFHVGSILAKLGVPNRAAAVRVALEHRLVRGNRDR